MQTGCASRLRRVRSALSVGGRLKRAAGSFLSILRSISTTVDMN